MREIIKMASSGATGESEDRMARVHAELADKEREALEAIKEDVCQWLTTVLELKVTAKTFMEVLDTGIALCNLATLIQRSAKVAEECGKNLNFKAPMHAISCNVKAEQGSFYARDNASNFIGWCRELGIEESVIFESDGLVVHRDEKRVILCLLDVARYAEQVGITPPQLVRMEREIETLETPSGVGTVSEEKESELQEERPPQPKRAREESEESPPQPKRAREESEESPPQPKGAREESEESPPQPKGAREESEESPPQPKRAREESEESPPQPKRAREESEESPPQPKGAREESEESPPQPKGAREESEESPPQPKRAREESEESPPQPKGAREGPEERREGPEDCPSQSKQSNQEVLVTSERKKKVQKKADTVDDKVARILGQCSCKDSEKLQAERCGNGKFILRGEHLKKPGEKKIIVYARLLSDRIMVRVGGGWDSLDHFLLKHDPCRINVSVTSGSRQRGTVLGKHKRED